MGSSFCVLVFLQGRNRGPKVAGDQDAEIRNTIGIGWAGVLIVEKGNIVSSLNGFMAGGLHCFTIHNYPKFEGTNSLMVPFITKVVDETGPHDSGGAFGQMREI